MPKNVRPSHYGADMNRYESRRIPEVTIQVPLHTSTGEAEWLAEMLPYVAAVVFEGTDTTCVLTAPGCVRPGRLRRAGPAGQRGLSLKSGICVVPTG